MRYHNFDIWIDAPQQQGYPVRAASERLGEARGWLNRDFPDAVFMSVLEKITAQRISGDALRLFGEQLFNTLFSGQVATLYHRSMGGVLARDGEGLRIRLRIEAPRLAGLPWEYLAIPNEEGFLATRPDGSIVRYLEMARPIRQLRIRDVFRLLIVMPEYAGTTGSHAPLDGGAEIERILHSLRADVAVTLLQGPLTPQDFSDALLEQHFHVLHYIGHSEFSATGGRLIFSDGAVLDNRYLGQLLGNQLQLKLVVLNSCEGGRVSMQEPMLGLAPTLVKAGVPAVVAMQASLFDDTAVMFADAFYKALFSGVQRGRVDCAMTLARSQLHREFPQEPGFGIPVLFMRSPTGILFDSSSGVPVSRSAADASTTVMAAHQENLHLLEALPPAVLAEPEVSREIDESRRAILTLRQHLHYRNLLIRTMGAAVLVAFLAAWLQLFDVLGVDTKLESYLVWAGDKLIEPPVSDRLRLVVIDAETEARLGAAFGRDWRNKHARVIDSLVKRRVAVIAFDLYFPMSTDDDDLLADSITRARAKGVQVVFGFRSASAGQPDIAPALLQGGVEPALVCTGTRLSLARSVPLAIETGRAAEYGGGQFVRTLAYAAFLAATDSQLQAIDWKRKLLIQSGSTGRTMPFSTISTIDHVFRDCPALRPGDRMAQLFVSMLPLPVLRGPQRMIPYETLLDQHRSGGQWRDAVVIVGVSAERDRLRHLAGGERQYFGYELHASAVNALLMHRIVRPLGPLAEFGGIVFAVLIGAWVAVKQNKRGGFWRYIPILAVLVLSCFVMVVLYARYQWLANGVYFLLAIILSWGWFARPQMKNPD